jgi:tetratricopeptide (TPR) repeat protein
MRNEMKKRLLCAVFAVLTAAAAFAQSRTGGGDTDIARYTEAISRNPNDAVAYKNRGYAYLMKSEYDNAIADYSQVIRRNPNDADVYKSRGYAYLMKREYDNAIADYSQAIRFNPNDADAYSRRGYARRVRKAGGFGVHLGFAPEKEEDVDKLIAEQEKIIADFIEARRLEPNNAEYRRQLYIAYNSQAIHYDWKYDSDTAIIYFTKAIETDPTNTRDGGYSGRASTYSERGEYDKAIADWTESIRLTVMQGENPSSTYVVRGYDYKHKGDYARARADFEKAVELDGGGYWGREAKEQLERLREEGH